MSGLIAPGTEIVERVRQLVEAFQHERSTLRGLVNGLDLVLEEERGTHDPAWLAELRAIWGQLEIALALADDEGRTALTEEEAGVVDQAIKSLVAKLEPY